MKQFIVFVNILLIILVTVLVLQLSACTPTTNNSPNIDLSPIHSPRPDPINMSPVHWSFINYSNVNEKIKDNGETMVCLSWDDYLVMGQNMTSITRYLNDTNHLLCSYRKELNEVQCSIEENVE